MDTKRGELWLMFDNKTQAADARKRFLEKYGVEPQQVKSGLGYILAGPVVEEDK
jgi:hypothetical protein